MARSASCIALLTVMAGPASAEPQSTAAAVATQAQSATPSTVGDSQAEVTIRAQRQAIQRQARSFVKKVTGSSWADANLHPLEMWRKPICPLVAGWPREQGQFLFDRLTNVLTSIGVRAGATGCRPNVYIVATAEPDALVQAWYKRDRRMPRRVKKVFEKALPVRVWYQDVLAGDGGVEAGVGAPGNASGGANGLLEDVPTFPGGRKGTRLGIGAVPDLSMVVAIVDVGRMAGVNWGQLADYIAMLALTNVDVGADFHDVPSILSLFSTSAQERPKGLTPWDQAYLKALYHTDRMSPLQRVSIRLQMTSQMRLDNGLEAPPQ